MIKMITFEFIFKEIRKALMRHKNVKTRKKEKLSLQQQLPPLRPSHFSPSHARTGRQKLNKIRDSALIYVNT